MPPSDPRRPVRGRGPARGQVAAWSVLPAAAVIIIVGGLFWASVWIVFRSPSTRAVAPAGSSELIAASDPIDAEVLPIDEAFALDDESLQDDGEALMVPDESEAEYVARGPGSADEQAYGEAVAEVRAQQIAEARAQQIAEARAQQIADADLDGYGDDDGEAVAYAPSYEDDGYLVAGPIYGPPAPDGFWDGVDSASAVASADDDQGYITAGEITARAAELTSRTLELTLKAEELTTRIEGLTSRMEELQTRIEISAVPSPVPSPGPTVAQGQTARQSTETVTVRNNVQAPVGGRAPWVILPQPAAGSKVAAGPITLEARARGEAPITKITFQLDGVAIGAALDRRDETTWRGRASAQVRPGPHTVAVFVVDEKGRTGSYRWEFTAGP